jgi:hypothetical protein
MFPARLDPLFNSPLLTARGEYPSARALPGQRIEVTRFI